MTVLEERRKSIQGTAPPIRVLTAAHAELLYHEFCHTDHCYLLDWEYHLSKECIKPKLLMNGVSVVETAGQSLSTLVMPIITYFERLIIKQHIG